MDKLNCSKCSEEFQKSAEEKTMSCQICINELKSDILVFQVFKWICYSLAIFVFLMFINLSFAEESTNGNYIIPGKTRTVMSKERLNTLKILIPIIAVSFGIVGFYSGRKEDEKKSA